MLVKGVEITHRLSYADYRDAELYAIGCMVSNLKACRCLAIRYDRIAADLLSNIHLAAAII